VAVHLTTKQMQEEVRVYSGPFSEFSQDSNIDIFDRIDPDGEISVPDLSDSC
jgi:hypothetical protein